MKRPWWAHLAEFAVVTACVTVLMLATAQHPSADDLARAGGASVLGFFSGRLTEMLTKMLGAK